MPLIFRRHAFIISLFRRHCHAMLMFRYFLRRHAADGLRLLTPPC
jgi:hypothetical protein